MARRLDSVPARFRPHVWSSETELWGLLRGRLTRFDVSTGEVREFPHDAWSVDGAAGVVSWRNGAGTWVLRGDSSPVLLAAPGVDTATGFEGPIVALWSRDGLRALLQWQGEWDSVFGLLEADGSMRRLEFGLRGYYGKSAALWLDQDRILFETVAMGPRGEVPTYRESGWRGDLALLELQTTAFTRLTNVRDFTALKVAGPLGSDVLVSEWDTTGVSAHWLYNAQWQRRPAEVPGGRAFAARGGAVVVLTNLQSDSTPAVLVSDGGQTRLGHVARDAEPVFSPGGGRGALLTDRGLLLLEPIRH